MSPTGQVRFQIGMHSPGQVAAPRRWTSASSVLPVTGYYFRSAPATDRSIEPKLWADVYVCVRTRYTTHAQNHARG